MELDMELGVKPRPPATSPERSTRCLHPARRATRCKHRLHLSASAHTPYCSACVSATARLRMDGALDYLHYRGGPHPPREKIDSRWKRANLSYKAKARRWEQVQKRGQLQSEREQAWDQAHSGMGAEDGATGSAASNTECTICDAMMHQSETAQEVPVVDTMAWWERPGALAPYAAPKAALRPRQSRIRNRVRGSSTIRDLVRQRHAAHAAERALREEQERRWNTETAIRRRHQLEPDTHFDADFWDSPISGLITRRSHKKLKEYQRMEERRARGNKPRPRPPRSSLSHCESVGQVDVDGEAAEQLRTAEEAAERERWERKARRVGAEVGYLYFLGTVNGLDDWREEYLRSDHSLIWRNEQQWEDEMDIDE